MIHLQKVCFSLQNALLLYLYFLSLRSQRVLIDWHPCFSLISQAHKLLRGLVFAAAPLAASLPFSVLVNQQSSVYRKHSGSLGLIFKLGLNIVVIAVLQVYAFTHSFQRPLSHFCFATSGSRKRRPVSLQAPDGKAAHLRKVS